jgi:hypothetical protein
VDDHEPYPESLAEGGGKLQGIAGALRIVHAA